MHNGYINIINPFRGTIVLGTPGSGKSFGIIDPFIRQHARKGFAMMVYDYKFPTLAKTLFYQYCKNLHYGNLPNGCGFRIVNFTDVEYSNRINPIQRKYIPDLAAAFGDGGHASCPRSTRAVARKRAARRLSSPTRQRISSRRSSISFCEFPPDRFSEREKLKRYISHEGQEIGACDTQLGRFQRSGRERRGHA